MRKEHLFFTVTTLLFFIGVLLLQDISKKSPLTNPSSTPTRHILGSSITDVPAIVSTCHEHDGLPDPACTPGSADPHVTQDTIASTICISGYTKTVRPPVSYTEALKKQQIIAYGYEDKQLKDYEEDHLISLELGGNPTDPKNLWPEPGNSPNPKDKIENLCHEKVCSGQLSLGEAQKEIATDWETACQ